MKINISVAQNSHYGVAIDTFAREVDARTNGRYKIQTFYAGALGAERESVEGVQLGTLDLTLTSTGPLPNFVPEVAIFDIPFLFRDYAHARAVLDGPIGQDMLQKFPPKGMVALAWGENGFRHMTNSKRPVNVPDDLKGLKMRTMENPIHIQAYKQFGILPTPMAFTEVFTALQQGTVDGQENPLSVITSAKLDQVQKNLSLTGHVYSPAVILMNKAQWDKLSAADKQAFLDAAKEAVKANRARIDDDERKAAFTEVFTALQQGTVDGQENPLSVITSAKLDQVQKNLSLTGHVYSPAVILMNKAQWDKLSAADGRRSSTPPGRRSRPTAPASTTTRRRPWPISAPKGWPWSKTSTRPNSRPRSRPSTLTSASGSARTTSTGSRTTNSAGPARPINPAGRPSLAGAAGRRERPRKESPDASPKRR